MWDGATLRLPPHWKVKPPGRWNDAHRRAGRPHRVSAKTLRFYEQAGLLHEPARTAGGYRDYDPAAHDRVVFIRRAQHAGLTLRQINEILAIGDDGRPPCDHVIRLVDHQLAEVERRLDELRRTRRDLRALHDRLADLDTSTCADHRICSAIDGQS